MAQSLLFGISNCHVFLILEFAKKHVRRQKEQALAESPLAAHTHDNDFLYEGSFEDLSLFELPNYFIPFASI